MKRRVTWGFKEWVVVVLVLAYSTLLIAAGVGQRDVDLLAGGLVMTLIAHGWLALYIRWGGLW